MNVKLIATTICILLLQGCKEEKVPERFYPRNDHHAYWYSLKQANLLETALVKDWLEAAEKPFAQQIEVKLPYQESFTLSEIKPEALGYRFDVKRGQKVLVDIQLFSPDTTRVFVDLFRVENDSLSEYLQVASADSTLQLGFEPRKNASYILRLQPELLRGGQFTITIENVPTLAFPVAGKDYRAIQSFFGDPRDGGRRDHHGVDIFAKRHTPIIAPVKAEVRFVGVRGLGGKVVWLYDRERGNNLYFAHLQDQKVNKYQMVNPGDTIGTVGNTGNARYTPPHLHFGIYRNGPMDPYSFIVEEYPRPPKLIPDTMLLGKLFAVNKAMYLKSAMSNQSLNLDTLDTGSFIAVNAVNHEYVRVATENGIVGFLDKSEVYSFLP
ncbi:Murein DD-endopeptidase MepM and murein hydrolase activator NlpD, contain LysM domain [Ekhidna lutea]|uniref:Murein DD-endopeptidase MepM and murein hydrolase activator NlpD, contain LysM domain n=1 Tax=Ekhidna lutea TaxID=447679 RepID=A0A239LA19_EKHLU|nr:M23 family metallopeptidase [Ekhidna lutea]SNT27125.1 Murein DD-endopeptidase MepM and murein hydrolase activator NlpD, contain LysM domain [Ekhidna lutea]